MNVIYKENGFLTRIQFPTFPMATVKFNLKFRCSQVKMKIKAWMKVKSSNSNTSPDVKTHEILCFSHWFVQISKTRRPMKVNKGHSKWCQTKEAGSNRCVCCLLWSWTLFSWWPKLFRPIPSLVAQGSVCVCQSRLEKTNARIGGFQHMFIHACLHLKSMCMPACHVNTSMIRSEIILQPIKKFTNKYSNYLNSISYNKFLATSKK